jgi:hypothetical protein
MVARVEGVCCLAAAAAMLVCVAHTAPLPCPSHTSWPNRNGSQLVKEVREEKDKDTLLFSRNTPMCAAPQLCRPPPLSLAHNFFYKNRNGSQLVKEVREKKDKATLLFSGNTPMCAAPQLCRPRPLSLAHNFFYNNRNGSQLVKEVREKKDKDKSRLRFWDMAGSKMGQITGLTTDEQQEAAKRAEEQVGWYLR